MLTHIGGTGWQCSVAQAAEAIRAGTIFFVTIAAESYIVSIGSRGNGEIFLRTALGEEDSSMLLRLPECASQSRQR